MIWIYLLSPAYGVIFAALTMTRALDRGDTGLAFMAAVAGAGCVAQVWMVTRPLQDGEDL